MKTMVPSVRDVVGLVLERVFSTSREFVFHFVGDLVLVIGAESRGTLNNEPDQVPQILGSEWADNNSYMAERCGIFTPEEGEAVRLRQRALRDAQEEKDARSLYERLKARFERKESY